MRRITTLWVTACAAMLSGCGALAGGAARDATPAARHATSGTISWSRPHIHLQYPTEPPKKVVLNFWGPDGYFTEPMSCQHNSKIAISHGKTRGNPSGDEYVEYSFRAKSAGPDQCEFDAVLGTTGSPPIAILKITIGGSVIRPT